MSYKTRVNGTASQIGNTYKENERAPNRLPQRAGMAPNNRVDGVRERTFDNPYHPGFQDEKVSQYAQDNPYHPDFQSDQAAQDLTVKEVQIYRAEGDSSDSSVGRWETYGSIEAANAALHRNSLTMPEDQQGYDKHDFKIIFTNGQIYEGIYDLYRHEHGDIAKHVTDFGNYALSPQGQKHNPVSSQEKEEWQRVIEAVNRKKVIEKESEKNMVSSNRKDLAPYVYQTTIGHYGGRYVDVPEERFNEFKGMFPASEFPKKVETHDLSDQNKYGSGALGRFKQVFPQYSGRTKEVKFANGSKGLKRLEDHFNLPIERETNPGD